MNNSIVLTVIADDQPGIIRTVSRVLRNHSGNWTQSSMSTLAGQFAGILLVSVPSENTDACLIELEGLKAQGLRVITHVSVAGVDVAETQLYKLELIGNDRSGIVHDITNLLANHGVSIKDLVTRVESASMSGDDLFKATAELVVPVGVDVYDLERELEDLANDLMVKISFAK
jgi:glycine cleavage system regulatory protein